MSVPTVPTVPTSTRQGGNSEKAQISAPFHPLVPTVPTYFYMRDKKRKARGNHATLCILWPKDDDFGGNGGNRLKGPQISAPSKCSYPGAAGGNAVRSVGTP